MVFTVGRGRMAKGKKQLNEAVGICFSGNSCVQPSSENWMNRFLTLRALIFTS